jgi:hypothetical protein
MSTSTIQPYPYWPDMHGCDIVGIQRGYLDSTISTPFENGMSQTRPRFPRVRRSFVVPYRYVSPADRGALDDFIRNSVLGSSGIFIWIDPETAEEIPVRFSPGKCPQITEAGWVSQTVVHSFNVELEEV